MILQSLEVAISHQYMLPFHPYVVNAFYTMKIKSNDKKICFHDLIIKFKYIYYKREMNSLLYINKKSFQINESFFKVGLVVITPRLVRALHQLLLQSLQCWPL